MQPASGEAKIYGSGWETRDEFRLWVSEVGLSAMMSPHEWVRGSASPREGMALAGTAGEEILNTMSMLVRTGRSDWVPDLMGGIAISHRPFRWRQGISDLFSDAVKRGDPSALVQVVNASPSFLRMSPQDVIQCCRTEIMSQSLKGRIGRTFLKKLGLVLDQLESDCGLDLWEFPDLDPQVDGRPVLPWDVPTLPVSAQALSCDLDFMRVAQLPGHEPASGLGFFFMDRLAKNDRAFYRLNEQFPLLGVMVMRSVFLGDPASMGERAVVDPLPGNPPVEISWLRHALKRKFNYPGLGRWFSVALMPGEGGTAVLRPGVHLGMLDALCDEIVPRTMTMGLAQIARALAATRVAVSPADPDVVNAVDRLRAKLSDVLIRRGVSSSAVPPSSAQAIAGRPSGGSGSLRK